MVRTVKYKFVGSSLMKRIDWGGKIPYVSWFYHDGNGWEKVRDYPSN